MSTKDREISILTKLKEVDCKVRFVTTLTGLVYHIQRDGHLLCNASNQMFYSSKEIKTHPFHMCNNCYYEFMWKDELTTQPGYDIIWRCSFTVKKRYCKNNRVDDKYCLNHQKCIIKNIHNYFCMDVTKLIIKYL